MDSTPAARAADLHAAFEDPTITAINTSIGGDHEIRVLHHLDRELIAANPKPFFGYSDNTNLLVHLWNTAIVGYHGGSVMYDLGRPVAMHPLTRASFETPLFELTEYNLIEPPSYGAVDLPWSDPTTFARDRPRHGLGLRDRGRVNGLAGREAPNQSAQEATSSPVRALPLGSRVGRGPV